MKILAFIVDVRAKASGINPCISRYCQTEAVLGTLAYGAPNVVADSAMEGLFILGVDRIVLAA